MIHFLQITIQSKAHDDFRSFLDWADGETMTCYQLRGYGHTPGDAANDAWNKYNENRDFYVTESWSWE